MGVQVLAAQDFKDEVEVQQGLAARTDLWVPGGLWLGGDALCTLHNKPLAVAFGFQTFWSRKDVT